jgi:mannose-1-phosphate guanylyltransferase/phosphomannomutase
MQKREVNAMKGVILAGGKGTRLRPLTCNLPKPMLPLLNKPVMEYSLELLKKHGIQEIAVTVQYMSSAIENYFGDGSKWGVKIRYFEDAPPLGTAGSIKQAEEFLDEPFVVISGDALTDFNLSKGIDFHKSEDRIVTIFQKEVSNPLDFGLVVTNDVGKVVKYIEKPNWNEVISNTVNTGIYIMNPEIFSYMQSNQFCDFSHDIFPLLLEENERVCGYLSDGYWLDIGAFSQYRQAHFDLLTKKVDVEIGCTEVFPSVWMGEGVRIEEGATIRGPVLIGDEAVIKTGAIIEPYSVIGKNSKVCEYAHLTKTILWNDVYIGKHCELNSTTIAHGTVVEDGVTLFEKSILADHCKLGKNIVVKANVKIWPGKVIDGSSVLTSSIVSEQETPSSLFSRGSITGKANINITPEQVVKIACAYGSTLPFKSTILIGSDCHPYSQLLMRMFMNTVHAAGIHTLEYNETNDSCFRYAVSQQCVEGGVFFYMQDIDEEVTIRFYNSTGFLVTTRKEKEIETAYMSEQSRHAALQSIGLNTVVHMDQEQYVHSLGDILDIPLIRQRRFHLLVNKLEGSFHSAVMSFFHLLGCRITWVYSHENEDHIKSLVQSSHANMGIIFHEQGNSFELYDAHGNVYTSIGQDSVYIPEGLIHKEAGSVYPLSLRRGASYITCYVEQTSAAGDAVHFRHDALFRLGKLLEIISWKNLPLYAIFKNHPQFHLLWDEVICPWKEKGKVMRMLLDDVPQQELELLDGIKFNYEDGEWSYIVSDSRQPKLIVYSHSLSPVMAKKKITHLIEKIRQYQKV